MPQDGRAFESTGADPELAYSFAFNMITGAQSVPGLIANADDFVLNNQESDRGGISAVCDQQVALAALAPLAFVLRVCVLLSHLPSRLRFYARRTLFELYYRGYKGAVDANVGSFMCSYNLINVRNPAHTAHTDS